MCREFRISVMIGDRCALQHPKVWARSGPSLRTVSAAALRDEPDFRVFELNVRIRVAIAAKTTIQMIKGAVLRS